jgi:hypothetical protein
MTYGAQFQVNLPRFMTAPTVNTVLHIELKLYIY